MHLQFLYKGEPWILQVAMQMITQFIELAKWGKPRSYEGWESTKYIFLVLEIYNFEDMEHAACCNLIVSFSLSKVFCFMILQKCLRGFSAVDVKRRNCLPPFYAIRLQRLMKWDRVFTLEMAAGGEKSLLYIDWAIETFFKGCRRLESLSMRFSHIQYVPSSSS